VVKGISKRVVVVKPEEHGIFEEAIFIVRGDAHGVHERTADDILKEACRIAAGCTGGNNGSVRRFLTALSFSAIGAAVTGLVWLLTAL